MNAPTSTRRVLLVDTEVRWLEFGQTALTEAGYSVDIDRSADGACHYLQDRDFGLVVVDLKEAEHQVSSLRQISDIQSRKGYRVIVVFPTSLTPGCMRKMFKLGVHDCVDKEYASDGLGNLVNMQFAEIEGSNIERMRK
jgi:DNA-binding NtrC family response regulator